MKDTDNIVFALKSFDKNDEILTHKGFLLFPDEMKADEFLAFFNDLNKSSSTSHYEKYKFVKTTDYAYEKTQTQKHFFVFQVKENE